MIGRRALFGLAGFAIVLPLGPPEAANVIDAKDLIEREVLQGGWPSPDGSKVLYAVDQANLASNNTKTHLWIKEMDVEGPPTEIPIEGRSFEWSTRGDALLYIGNEGNVEEWSLEKHREREILNAAKLKTLFPGSQTVSILGVNIAPVGERAALMLNVVARVDLHPDHGVEVSPVWRASLSMSDDAIIAPLQRGTVAILDLATGTITRSLPEKFDIQGFSPDQMVTWSPDGRRLGFSASVEQPSGTASAFMSSDLYVMDVESGSIDQIVVQRGWDMSPKWSPDGRLIAFNTLGGKEDWRYNSQIGIVDVRATLPSISLPTATQSDDPRTRWIGAMGDWSLDSRKFYYSARARGHTRFVGVDAVTGTVLEPIDNRDVNLYVEPMKARNSDLFVFKGDSFVQWPDLYSWRPGEAGLRRLTFLNSKLNSASFFQTSEVHWLSADRQFQLQGFLLTPLADGAQKKPPLIAFVGGGPTQVDSNAMQAQLPEFPWPLFLQEGYAVFIPNTRGREGFGPRFLHALDVDRSQNRVPATDVVAGVKWLISQGKVDPCRIGIASHSYGGGVAASATEQSGLFRASMIHEGTAVVLGSAEAYSAEHWRLESAKQIGLGSPIDRANRSIYLRDSPAEYADRVKAPTLLIYGIRGNAATQGREFYAALQYYKVPSELIIQPRTGHNSQEPQLIADNYRRNLEWFDYWLKGIATERMRERYGSRRVTPDARGCGL